VKVSKIPAETWSKATAEFDYVSTVDEIARSCSISATKYNISSKPARVKNQQKTQSAVVVLNEIDIRRFSEFLK